MRTLLEVLYDKAKEEAQDEYHASRRYDRECRFTSIERFTEILLENLVDNYPAIKEHVENYLKELNEKGYS